MKLDKIKELKDYFNAYALKTIKKDTDEYKTYRSNKLELARLLTKVNCKEIKGGN